MICLGFICLNCLHNSIKRNHVTFIHSLQAFKFVHALSSDSRGIKGECRGAFQASEQFHRICQTTHHTTTPMDFFVDLFTITSNNPEAEPAPSAPVDAGGGNGGCIVA